MHHPSRMGTRGGCRWGLRRSRARRVGGGDATGVARPDQRRRLSGLHIQLPCDIVALMQASTSAQTLYIKHSCKSTFLYRFYRNAFVGRHGACKPLFVCMDNMSWSLNEHYHERYTILGSYHTMYGDRAVAARNRCRRRSCEDLLCAVINHSE